MLQQNNYFLRYHDYKIIADSKDSISMVKKVAQGKIKINGISDWLKDNTISNNNKFDQHIRSHFCNYIDQLTLVIN